MLTADKTFLSPNDISFTEVSLREMVAFQRAASKITWRPSPGRHLSYILTHDMRIIGLVHLASPVMTMTKRDRHLRLPEDPKLRGAALKNYMDLSVCVGIQPLAWYWNLGKLCAMCSTTLCPAYKEKYGEQLFGICTTSVWGRSSQYNKVFANIGYTKGFGHEHVSDEQMKMMRERLDRAGWKGSNWKHSRMAVVQAYARFLGRDPNKSVHHGHRRGIYYAPTVFYDAPTMILEWYKRWGLPRWERTRDQTPPYTDGLSGGRAATETRTQGQTPRLFY